jgi:hypothetical protein
MQAPAIICVLRAPDHVELVQSALSGPLHDRELLGKPIREALPELAGQGFFETLDRVFASVEPFHGSEVPARLDRAGTETLEQGYCPRPDRGRAA